MKLVASAIVRNELGRYLDPWLEHLAAFCDGIVVFDDASDDGTSDELSVRPEVTRIMRPADGQPCFDRHEGEARQALLRLTLAEEPTHILAIDADEFVADGLALRRTLQQRAPNEVAHGWALRMHEVWEIDGDCLCVRVDGRWRPYHATVLWRPDAVRDPRIAQRKLGGGRVPTGMSTPRFLPNELLHFGWTNPDTRRARFNRYMEIDGGRYHSRAHLESIMHEPRLEGIEWPKGLAGVRDRIEEVASPAFGVA